MASPIRVVVGQSPPILPSFARLRGPGMGADPLAGPAVGSRGREGDPSAAPRPARPAPPSGLARGQAVNPPEARLPWPGRAPAILGEPGPPRRPGGGAAGVRARARAGALPRPPARPRAGGRVPCFPIVEGPGGMPGRAPLDDGPPRRGGGAARTVGPAEQQGGEGEEDGARHPPRPRPGLHGGGGAPAPRPPLPGDPRGDPRRKGKLAGERERRGTNNPKRETRGGPR